MTQAVQTNLARKWRSKTFNQMVGQELAVRILQNSLFKNYFFPVYLFAGQRGCGKTTSARLFAAALNCQALSLFQKDPRSCTLPCLTCPSCQAMAQGNHPDFIEMDAASHTGVDNVRQIIDAASLMPVLGQKKVYLIDEAHMLSKAAFNAFLKILEEPPASVVFMLATTDPHKIIDTVRSRCFQLFFGPIAADDLQKHLIHVCQEEQIKASPEALYTIVHETEGSARDALNLLEQVRFSHLEVSQEAVLQVIGHLPEPALFDLIQAVIEKDTAQVLTLCQNLNLQKYVVTSIWQKIVFLLKSMVYVHYKTPTTGIQDKERLTALAQAVSPAWLAKALRHTHDYEQTLLKSTAQADLLELMLVELSTLADGTHEPLKPSFKPKIELPKAPVIPAATLPKEREPIAQPVEAVEKKSQSNTTVSEESDPRWVTFLQAVEQLSDPLLISIFKQGTLKSVNQETGDLEILFNKEATFFGQWLTQTKTVWEPLLKNVFGPQATMHAKFEKEGALPKMATPKREEYITKQPQTVGTVKPATPQKTSKPFEKTFVKKNTHASAAALLPPMTAIDIKDKEKWPKAHQLLEQFGGTIGELKGEITYAE